MGEQKLGQTGVVDDAQAANLGKVLGVDAIISGTITSSSEDKHSKEKRTISRKKEEGGDYEIEVNCLTRSARATAKLRIVSTETAQVLGQTESGGFREDKKCDKEIGMVRSAQSLISGSIGDAAWGLVRYISPAFTRFEGELVKIKAKEYKQKAEEAGDIAESGDLDRAYAVYYSIYQQDSYNPEVLYNLGVLNEAVCNFADARQMYESAASLKPSEKDFSSAARRAEARVTELEALKTFGFEPTKHEWNTSEAALQQASAQKVTVRGGGSERVDVLVEPKEGSALVVKIPGGIQVQVVTAEGEWYKVKLPDGKEGWLPSSKVKK